MILLAKLLASLAFALSSAGGQVWHTDEAAASHVPVRALAFVPRAVYLHAPVHLPSNPRPCLPFLSENGIDEEDSERLDTPAVYFAPGAWPALDPARPSSFAARLDHLRPARGMPTSVLRC